MFRVISRYHLVPKMIIPSLFNGQRLSYFLRIGNKSSKPPFSKPMKSSKQEQTLKKFSKSTATEINPKASSNFASHSKKMEPQQNVPKNSEFSSVKNQKQFEQMKNNEQQKIDFFLNDKDVRDLQSSLSVLNRSDIAHSLQIAKERQQMIIFLSKLMDAAVVIENLQEKHPTLLPYLVNQLLIRGEIRKILVSNLQKKKELLNTFFDKYQEQVCQILDQQPFKLIIVLNSLTKISKINLKQMDSLERVLLLMRNRLIEQAARTDLSTSENMLAFENFLRELEFKSTSIGFQYKYFNVVVDQLPFFHPKVMNSCLFMIFTNPKISFLIKNKSFDSLLNILLMEDNFVVNNLSEIIIPIIVSLIRVTSKNYEIMLKRDTLITIIFLSVLKKKKTNSFPSLKFLEKYLRISQGKILTEEYQDSLHQAIMEYLELEIISLEVNKNLNISDKLTEIQEFLMTLKESNIIQQKKFKRDLKNIQKKIEDQIVNLSSLTSHPIFTFFKDDQTNASNSNFDDLKKLRTSQLFSKLKQGVKDNSLEVVKNIVILMLHPYGGHFFYSYARNNQLLDVQSIFSSAIKYLIQKNEIMILKQVFITILQKVQNKWIIKDIIVSLNKNNKLATEQLWGYFYLAWSQYYILEEDKNKHLGFLFQILIYISIRIENQGELLVNTYLYSALELINPDIFKDNDCLLNYFQLLDYLLKEEQSNKLISSLLYPIVIDLKIDQHQQLLQQNLPLFPMKLAQFKLRYIISPEAISGLCQQSLQPIQIESQQSSQKNVYKLNDQQQRLMSILRKEDTSKLQLLPLKKENLLILLLDIQKYSEKEREEIQLLLEQAQAHKLAEILSSPVVQLISRKNQRKVWQLLLEKLEDLDTIVWKPILMIFHKKIVFRGYLEQLVRTIIQRASTREVLIPLLGFHQITFALLSLNLLLDRKFIDPFFQSQVKVFLMDWKFMPQDIVIKRFQTYLLAGYRLSPQYITILLPKMVQNVKSYQILFHHEPILSEEEFQFLLAKFMTARFEYLSKIGHVENSQITELLKTQYYEDTKSFLDHCRKNWERKEERLEEKHIQSINNLLLSHYRGISLIQKAFIQINNTIIILTEEQYSEIKLSFYKKLLSCFSQTKNKKIKLIPLESNIFKSSILKKLEVQLNLKPKSNQKVPINEIQHSNTDLEKKLAGEIQELDNQKKPNKFKQNQN